MSYKNEGDGATKWFLRHHLRNHGLTVLRYFVKWGFMETLVKAYIICPYCLTLFCKTRFYGDASKGLHYMRHHGGAGTSTPVIYGWGLGILFFKMIFGIRVGNLFRIWFGGIDLGLKFGLWIEGRWWWFKRIWMGMETKIVCILEEDREFLMGIVV